MGVLHISLFLSLSLSLSLSFFLSFFLWLPARAKRGCTVADYNGRSTKQRLSAVREQSPRFDQSRPRHDCSWERLEKNSHISKGDDQSTIRLTKRREVGENRGLTSRIQIQIFILGKQRAKAGKIRLLRYVGPYRNLLPLVLVICLNLLPIQREARGRARSN
jgi:hypothetical protein